MLYEFIIKPIYLFVNNNIKSILKIVIMGNEVNNIMRFLFMNYILWKKRFFFIKIKNNLFFYKISKNIVVRILYSFFNKYKFFTINIRMLIPLFSPTIITPLF